MQSEKVKLISIIEDLEGKLLLAGMRVRELGCKCGCRTVGEKHKRGCPGVKAAKPYFLAIDGANRLLRKMDKAEVVP